MTKVYIVMDDYGYDGMFINSVFSSRKLAEEFINRKYPDAEYNQFEDIWRQEHYNKDLGKIWDGNLLIHEYKIDDEIKEE